MIFRVLLVLLAIGAVESPVATQEKIKVGYWSGGFSVGFGTVLEAGKFLEQQGLAPEYVRFTDVNAATKALITQSIDVAFAAPTTGAFTLAAQGAPIEIVLATQVAESTLVSKDGSPVHTLADLKGKKVGMSPVGSATYAIAAAVLERNHGLKRSDYTPIPGNEPQLVQFLRRGDIDAASLRAVTIASTPDLKLHVLGRVVDEWKRMTRSNAVPILATALVHKNFSRQQPEAVVKFVRAMIEATRFGRTETAKISEMLRRANKLDAGDAASYARLWNEVYLASMEPDDVATLKAMADVFRAGGTLEGNLPESLFATVPYARAKSRQ
jgi:NitT/TauT family transport system substrate-binding protein